MTNLKKNIDHYMELKGIKMYSHLLHSIALQLGYKGQKIYDFIKREKANFSKMLKGNRPLKYEYIIPLEKIFGVSLAKLVEEDAYKLPIEKELVPYLKGFRYYAYMDNDELYEKELTKLLNNEGQTIICKTDEFGKTFLDYVVEYNAQNGIRFLHKYYKLKLTFSPNHFNTEPKNIFWLHDGGIELCRMVANMNDLELFNSIYDPYYMFASFGYYLDHILYKQDDFYEIILDHEYLFTDMFKTKTYTYELTQMGKKKQKRDFVTFSSINPIMNGCLNYALKHLEKYKQQALEILKFGIVHNAKVKNELVQPLYNYFMDEIGGIKTRQNNDVIDIVIIVNERNIKDSEIIKLVDKLPAFDENYWR